MTSLLYMIFGFHALTAIDVHTVWHGGFIEGHSSNMNWPPATTHSSHTKFSMRKADRQSYFQKVDCWKCTSEGVFRRERETRFSNTTRRTGTWVFIWSFLLGFLFGIFYYTPKFVSFLFGVSPISKRKFPIICLWKRWSSPSISEIRCSKIHISLISKLGF